jgi:3-oxoadipate enol-lactonase
MNKMRQERIDSIRSRGMVAVFEGWFENLYTPEFAAARPEIVDWHRSITTSNDPEKYIQTLTGGTSSNIDLSKINAPLMIIVGAGDGYNPAGVANEFAQALKGTKPEVNVFPTRHGSPFERHEEYNQTLLGFLGKNRPRRK